MAFAALTVDLTAKIAKFEDSMNNATRSVDKLNAKAGALSAGMKAAFSGAAVLGLAAFAKSGIDAADALGKLSARTGASVKDLASLQLAAESSDTSLDDVGKAMLRLKVSIGDAATGNKTLGESLARLGVTAQDPKEQLYQLADAVKKGGGSSLVASDLNKVLGKSYSNLLPLLQQGGDALRKSAQESESFAEAMARLSPDAEKFNDELDKLKNYAAGAAADGIAPLVAGLNNVFDRFEKIAQLRNAGASLYEIITGKASADTGETLKRYNDEIAELETSLKRLKENSGGLDTSIAPLTAELTRLKKVREELQNMEADRLMTPPKSKSSPTNDALSGEISSLIDPEQANKIQAALKKAFSITPMDQFLEQFKDRRKKISDEYARMKADLTGPALDNVKGFDIQAELRKGQSALANNDAQGAEIAKERVKAMLEAFAASEGAASFEKSFFTDQIKAFELSIVDAEQKIAETAQETVNQKIGQLSKDTEQLKVSVDGDAIVAQVKSAVDQIKRDLASNPLQIPIVAVPTISPSGSQSVDLSRAALQHGRR